MSKRSDKRDARIARARARDYKESYRETLYRIHAYAVGYKRPSGTHGRSILFSLALLATLDHPRP